MKKHIILTGGTGFIGSHLLEGLLSEKYNVVLIKRSTSDLWRINHLINHENLTLTDDFENIFDTYKIGGVFHLATHYIKHHNYTDIENIIKSNIEFPSKLIDLSCESNVKYFINTGTFFEYELNLPLSESSKIHSFNLYSSTKIAFEEILKYYSNEFNIHTSTLKLFTPYGPRDDVNKIIPYMILNSINNTKINIKTPENRLDVVHVFDIVDAFLKLKNNILKFNDYEVFNVANNFSYTINDIYSAVKFNLGIGEKVKLNPEKYADTNKINNMLDWKAKIGLYEGIKNTIEYYKKDV